MLMRHAEAVSAGYGDRDFDRPLSQAGRSVAASMGRAVAESGCLLHALITSPAKRAFQTAELFAEAAEINVEIDCDARIYEAAPSELSSIVSEFEDEWVTTVLVGHNPGFESFIAHLTGSITPMRAGAVAVIELQIERWGELERDRGILIEILQPSSAA
jgi:phosphohistidine phosphatase